MLFHSTFKISSPWLLPLLLIKRYGNCGVDVFLFVSGVSLYFSLEKSNDTRAFYLRRLKRVWIPTLLVVIPWYALKAITEHNFSIIHYLLDISGLTLFVDGDRNIWFVTIITLCYAMYPALYSLYKSKRNPISVLLVTLCISIALNIFLRASFPTLWENSEILFRRIPIFLIGAYAGKYVYEDAGSLSNLQMLAIFAVCWLIFALLVTNCLDILSMRYMYIFLSIGAVFLFSVLGNIGKLSNAMALISPITLELYLFHGKLLTVLETLGPGLGNITISLLAFVLAFVCASVLSFVSKQVMARLPH